MIPPGPATRLHAEFQEIEDSDGGVLLALISAAQKRLFSLVDQMGLNLVYVWRVSLDLQMALQKRAPEPSEMRRALQTASATEALLRELAAARGISLEERA